MIVSLPETCCTRRTVFDILLWSAGRFNPNMIVTAFGNGRLCFVGIVAMRTGPSGKPQIRSTGILDASGNPIMFEDRMDPIGFTRFESE